MERYYDSHPYERNQFLFAWSAAQPKNPIM